MCYHFGIIAFILLFTIKLSIAEEPVPVLVQIMKVNVSEIQYTCYLQVSKVLRCNFIVYNATVGADINL